MRATLTLCSTLLLVACSGRAASMDGSEPGGPEAGADAGVDTSTLRGRCTYWAAGVCWRCGGSDVCPVKIGCRAGGDCALFCSQRMPDDYRQCNAGDASCKDWTPPLGTLGGCSYHPAGGGEPASYHCCFCPSILLGGMWAVDAKGKCHHFSTSCMPAAFQAARLDECP